MYAVLTSREGGKVSAEENKIMVRRMIEEVWNDHDPSAIDESVAPEYFNHAAVVEHWLGLIPEAVR